MKLERVFNTAMSFLVYTIIILIVFNLSFINQSLFELQESNAKIIEQNEALLLELSDMNEVLPKLTRKIIILEMILKEDEEY